MGRGAVKVPARAWARRVRVAVLKMPSLARRKAPGEVLGQAWVRKVPVAERALAPAWVHKVRVAAREVPTSVLRAVRRTHVAAAPNSVRRAAPAVREPIAAPATHGMTKHEQILA